ncbi:MAG TPA: hypothetical protein PLB55_17030, partial [Prosthecobacter sp.]|nr:hypothetical protein [Prosthecobacter sp.]
MMERAEWHARMRAHEARVAAHADAFVDRRSRGTKHPVHDFLFTYYSFAPAKLKQWVPPLGAGIEIAAADLEACPWLQSDRFIREGSMLRVDERRFTNREREFAAWVAMLCTRILGRAGRVTCFGLHEWAMVYRGEEVRHSEVPLRLSAAEVEAFVESRPFVCSHHDAFRFFTAAARPLNRVQPAYNKMHEMEQPGCLHTNMD